MCRVAQMFRLMDLIDKALKAKNQVTVVDKSGRFYYGAVYDSYVRISGGKLRGKIRFRSLEDKREIEIDANDILDIRF